MDKEHVMHIKHRILLNISKEKSLSSIITCMEFEVIGLSTVSQAQITDYPTIHLYVEFSTDHEDVAS